MSPYIPSFQPMFFHLIKSHMENCSIHNSKYLYKNAMPGSRDQEAGELQDWSVIIRKVLEHTQSWAQSTTSEGRRVWAYFLFYKWETLAQGVVN